MNMKQIKLDKWYRTSMGVGQVERVGGTYPPSVMVRIVAPLPRGLVNLRARDVLEEVPPPEAN